MMSLKLMNDVVHTSKDDTSTFVDTILQRWAHDPGSARFFRASANFLFTFTNDGAPYALRFNHARERRAEAVTAELDFVRHLGSQRVPVAQPVTSRAGSYVERVSTELGEFNAVVFNFIPGTQPESDEMTPEMFARWGHALGTLHNASAGYHAPGRPSWQDHLADVAENLSPGMSEARDLLRTLSQQLEVRPTSDATFGLIHFDFEPDNLIWQEDRVWAADFDDCAYYWFVADIAFALRDLFGDQPSGVDLGDAGVQAFVSGYCEVRAISDDDLASIPLFMAVHNLVSFAKLRRALGVPSESGEPDWLQELRQKLAAKVSFYQAVFTDSLS